MLRVLLVAFSPAAMHAISRNKRLAQRIVVYWAALFHWNAVEDKNGREARSLSMDMHRRGVEKTKEW